MSCATDFNLLPPRIRALVAARNATRRLTRWTCAIALCAGVVFSLFAWRARVAEARLASLRTEAAAIVVLEEQLRELGASIHATDAQIALQRSVASPIDASRLVHAIAALVPVDAVLERLSLRGENLNGEERAKRRRVESASARRYVCEVSGVAADDATIARFVEDLAARDPFQSVNLESSRNREFNGVEAREFRVSFSVDLDERWSVRTESAHAQAEGEKSP
ncbi:MAG: hypothetical protein EXS10_00055 [Phycisphaerales bacterium]|nr:hypothetical protein [Phycisphaerales bacterium]